MRDPEVAPGSRSYSPSADEEATVLVVEDDPSMAEILTTALGGRGYTVVVTRTAQSALASVDAHPPDLILLDLGLPDLDGLVVCDRVRQQSDIPVIVLTADGDEERKVEALDLGADDYVTKPFSTPELMARVRAALRRGSASGTAGPPDGPEIRVGRLSIDPDAYEVTVAGQPVRLTNKEFRLLHLLARRADHLVRREEILREVWGEGGSSDSLRVHVTHLRRKLGDRGSVEIRTEPGIGYRLCSTEGTGPERRNSLET